MQKKEILDYLKKSQQPNGSFLGYISDNGEDFHGVVGEESLAVTAQVLEILNRLATNDDIREIKTRAVGYILSQKNKDWTFKMFSGQSSSQASFDYDLNTTFLALTALFDHDKELIDGKGVAALLRILTESEVDEGGPYYSFADHRSGDKLDLGVNITISRFLKRQEVSLPNLDEYIRDAISKNHLFSDFYSERDGLSYNVMRLRAEDDAGPNAMLGPLTGYFEGLTDDFCRSRPFFKYVDPATGKKRYIWTRDVPAAICLVMMDESLPVARPAEATQAADDERILYEKIILRTRDSFDRAGNELKIALNEIFAKIVRFDKDRQIGLVAYYFKKAIGDEAKNIPDATLTRLGVANFYIWMAYTIYDDFLDDEGDAKFLSAANFCLRRYAVIFSDLSVDNRQFARYFDSVMDNLDSANAWEIAHCRAAVGDNRFYIPEEIPSYGDFGKLAERSLAHALGPIYLLHLVRHPGSQADVDNLYDFFKHYLIARQLDDDAHDWEDDLGRGHINSVVSLILSSATAEKTAKSGRFADMIDIKDDILNLRTEYWFKMIPDVSRLIQENIQKAKGSLKLLEFIEKPESLERILGDIENSAKKAIGEHAKVKDFLENFES